MASPNTIVLKGILSERYDEKRAAGAITPGHLVQQDADGAVVVHSTAYGAAETMFAIEDSFQGRTIDTAYASAELVRLHRAQKGDEIYAFLKATGGTATPATFLASAGDGTLIVTGGATGGPGGLFRALETVPQGTAAQRVRVAVV